MRYMVGEVINIVNELARWNKVSTWVTSSEDTIFISGNENKCMTPCVRIYVTNPNTKDTLLFYLSLSDIERLQCALNAYIEKSAK